MPAKKPPRPPADTFGERLHRVWLEHRVPKNKAAVDALRADPAADVPMGEPTYEEVADFITRTHVSVSAPYLGLLRRGERPKTGNPSLEIVDGLAAYFDVDADELLGRNSRDIGESLPDDQEPSEHTVLVDRLDRLYQTMRPAGRTEPLTDQEVAGAIGENAETLRAARRGEPIHDRADVILRLARYFGVPVEYLQHDADPELVARIEEQLGRFQAMLRLQADGAFNLGAFDVALRAFSSVKEPETQQALLRIVETIAAGERGGSSGSGGLDQR
jgi:transcriptional regulator with XRE-family HTH domain